MKAKFANAIGGAIVLLAVFTACGGSEGGPGGEKKAYIDSVDPLCADAIDEVDTIGDATDPVTLEKVSNVWVGLHQEVKAKKIPSEGFDQGSAFVASLFNVSAAASDAFNSALINDNAAMQRALNRQDQAKKTTSDLAGEYGFNECDHIDSAAESGEDEDHEDDH